MTTNDSASDVTTINSGTSGTPDLTVAKSHTVTFTQGGTGSYTVTVTNSGTAATSGTVTMSDTMPMELPRRPPAARGGHAASSAQAVAARSDALAAAGAIRRSLSRRTRRPPRRRRSPTRRPFPEAAIRIRPMMASDVTTINGVPDRPSPEYTATFHARRHRQAANTITAKNSGTAATLRHRHGLRCSSHRARLRRRQAARDGHAASRARPSRTRSDALAASSSYPAITLNEKLFHHRPVVGHQYGDRFWRRRDQYHERLRF